MIHSLFGSDTKVGMLRGGLEETSATHRGIAARVAAATSSSATGDFATELAARTGAAGEKPAVDLQLEMAALADTQIRYEACAKLLQGAYAGIRTAMRSNG
jgi:flagellar basal body rod protein FlgB